MFAEVGLVIEICLGGSYDRQMAMSLPERLLWLANGSVMCAGVGIVIGKWQGHVCPSWSWIWQIAMSSLSKGALSLQNCNVMIA